MNDRSIPPADAGRRSFLQQSAQAAVMAAACGRESGPSIRDAFSLCVNNGLSPQAALAQAQPMEPTVVCVNPRYDAYKDFIDQAATMVCNYPEILNFDGGTM